MRFRNVVYDKAHHKPESWEMFAINYWYRTLSGWHRLLAGLHNSPVFGYYRANPFGHAHLGDIKQ